MTEYSAAKDVPLIDLTTMVSTLRQFWTARKAAFFALSAVLISTIGMYYGCGSGVNLYSKQDDITLGQQMAAQIAADPAHYPVLNNPTIRSYVQSIENKIVSSPNVQNKDFNYYVTIINDDNTVNAFSIPGGPMYVYTGLMKFIDNEATLAGVIAHETTHADHRHATQQMTQQYGLETIAALALGQNSGVLQQAVASLAGNLALLKFSRDDERDADKGSFDDLNQLPGRPWYPAAIKYFMVKVLAQGEKTSSLQNLFNTHPPSQERLDNINKLAASAGLPEPSASQLNAQTYASYKSMVR